MSGEEERINGEKERKEKKRIKERKGNKIK